MLYRKHTQTFSGSTDRESSSFFLSFCSPLHKFEFPIIRIISRARENRNRLSGRKKRKEKVIPCVMLYQGIKSNRNSCSVVFIAVVVEQIDRRLQILYQQALKNQRDSSGMQSR